MFSLCRQKMHDILGSLSSMSEAMANSFEVDPVRKLIYLWLKFFFKFDQLIFCVIICSTCHSWCGAVKYISWAGQNKSLISKKTWTWSQLTNFPKKWRLEGVWCQQSGDLTLRRRIAARGNHVELKVTRRIGNCRDAMLLQLSHCKSSLASCPHCCDDMIISKQFI